MVVFANGQQEHLAKPRSLAVSKSAISKPVISTTDGALDNCRKVPDHSCRTGAPVASVRWAEDFEPFWFESRWSESRWFESRSFESCRNEMMFYRNSPSCYSGEPFTGFYAEVFETDDLIEQILPRKLGYGKNASG